MTAPGVDALTADRTVLLVVPVSNLAGVARHVIDLMRVGVPGWQLTVAAPEGPLLDEVRSLPRARSGVSAVPVAIEPAEGDRPGVRTDLAVRRLRSLVREMRPAIVHSHLARADLLAAMATVGLPPRLVSTEHHIPPDRFMFHSTPARARTMEAIHHLRLRRFRGLVAVSDSTRRDMVRWWHPTQPVRVILNGVDRRRASPRPEPGLRFLSLTRLSPEKNVEMSVRAFARIAGMHPEATLTVAGAGECLPALRGLAADLGVADRVSFPGFVDADQAMASHDVVLQPSKSDNCSYTLLDAVSEGMGVAASPIGGNPEILPDHCIAALDDLDGFVAVALEQALRPDRRPTLPARVPTVVGMAAQLSDVYDRVMRGERAA
ncbi:glycosyltransferase family 4 protein [Aestuariimicrobium soli]|uniref:glycosyltransferase family 4 protein n=1 Tax=Aestuariimicrobium soli TaxID=2035834 RepID=UPI003EB885EF